LKGRREMWKSVSGKGKRPGFEALSAFCKKKWSQRARRRKKVSQERESEEGRDDRHVSVERPRDQTNASGVDAKEGGEREIEA